MVYIYKHIMCLCMYLDLCMGLESAFFSGHICTVSEIAGVYMHIYTHSHMRIYMHANLSCI